MPKCGRRKMAALSWFESLALCLHCGYIEMFVCRIQLTTFFSQILQKKWIVYTVLLTVL